MEHLFSTLHMFTTFHIFNIEQLLFIIIFVMLFIYNGLKKEHFEIVLKCISLSYAGKKLEEANGVQENGRESIFF